MTKNEQIASILLEAAELLKEDQELDSLNEDIETMIVRNDVWRMKTVTLYHGTWVPNLKTIIPNSLNVGTRLSKERRSSYWTDDWQTAVTFAITHLLYNLKENISYHLAYGPKGEVKLVVLKTNMEKLTQLLKDHKTFVYEAEMDPKTIGAGHSGEVREFTMDKDVEVKKCTQISQSDLMKSIIPVDSFDSPQVLKLLKKKIGLLKRLVYHHNWAKRKIDSHYKSLSGVKSIQDVLRQYPVDLCRTDIKYKNVTVLVNCADMYYLLCSDKINLKNLIFEDLDKAGVPNGYVLGTVIVHMLSLSSVKVTAYCYNKLNNRDTKVIYFSYGQKQD